MMYKYKVVDIHVLFQQKNIVVILCSVQHPDKNACDCLFYKKEQKNVKIM